MGSQPLELPPGFLEALQAVDAETRQATAGSDATAERIIVQAALLGSFDLAWVDARIRAGGSGDGAELERLRSTILDASDCLDRGAGLWQLRLDHRRNVIEGLLGDPAQDDRLRAARPIPGDDRGPLLIAWLQQPWDIDLTAAADAELPAMLDVATWLEGLSLAVPTARAVRREEMRRRRLADFAEMISRFVGREETLERITSFADGPSRSKTQLLSVSGVGGIGKSALLARFLHARMDRPARSTQLIIHVDFDRVAFAVSDGGQLDFELTRQLALEVPALAAELDGLRHNVRHARRRARGLSPSGTAPASRQTHAVESADLSRSDILFELAFLCETHGLLGATLLFVFDTVEELQTQSEYGLSDLAEWIRAVRQKVGFTDIRVIACGRAEVAFPDGMEVETASPIVLDELGPASAVNLLGEYGIDARTAERAVARYGGNPLVLRLIARLIEQRGPQLLDEADLGGGTIDCELVQGMLYRRILGHIKNKRVQQLAYPGLVLRRVTPALIREVIAPISLVPPIEPGEEEALFQALGRQIWLVRPSDIPGTVEHRTDIRRVMMTMMEKDPVQGAVGQQIHRAAIEYYRSKGGSAVPGAHSEALYHCFMVHDGVMLHHLTPEIAQAAQEAIGASIGELPYENRVALRMALGQFVSDEDARHAPPYLWFEFVARRGPELVAREEYAAALALFEMRSLILWDWSATALDALGQWDELARISEVDLARYDAEPKSTEPGPPPPPGMPLRIDRVVAIATALLKAGQIDEARELATAELDGQSPSYEGSRAQLRCGQIVARCLDEMRAGGALNHRFDFRTTSSDLLRDNALATEYLRYVQVTGQLETMSVRPLPSLFYPSAKWVDRLRGIGGPQVAEALGKLAAEMRGTDPRRLTTGRLLNQLGDSFAEALTGPFVRGEITPEARLHMGAIVEYPEFRTVARAAILDAVRSTSDNFPPAKAFGAMLDALRPSLPMVPQDLDAVIASSEREQREYASLLVAFADRCQLLPQLIMIARSFAPGAHLPAKAALSLDVWRTAGEAAMQARVQPYVR